MSAKHTPESFWTKVKKQPNGCWNWQGCTNTPNGYGLVRWDRKQRCAHRVAAYLSGLVTSVSAPKSAQDKTHVLHNCDNKLCCNPAHLYLGNFSDNLRDAYKTGVKKPPCGERATSKLNEMTVKQIFKKCFEGHTLASIADAYGVSTAMIAHIKHGRKWSHVTNKRYIR